MQKWGSCHCGDFGTCGTLPRFTLLFDYQYLCSALLVVFFMRMNVLLLVDSAVVSAVGSGALELEIGWTHDASVGELKLSSQYLPTLQLWGS